MRKTTVLTVAGFAFAMLLALGVPRASAGVDIAIGIPLPGVAVYAPAPPLYYPAPPPVFYPRPYYAPSYSYYGYVGGWGHRHWHGGGHRWHGGHGGHGRHGYRR